MLIVSTEAHRSHHGLEVHNGVLDLSAESPQRADIIITALREAGHDIIEPADFDRDLTERIHTPEYVEFLETTWQRWSDRYDSPAAMPFMWPARGLASRRPTDLVGQLGYHSFGADTTIVAGTWTAATAAAAAATTATDRLMDSGSTTYALCRPPGHHAAADQFGGYCYLNNAALAAQRLLDRGASRIAVLDIDYHHGNGTQSIFFDRDDVLVVSIHADPLEEFPWFSGYADEVGSGNGEGWNFNLPLPRGASQSDWFDALGTAVERIATAGVDALVVSLGLDTFVDDPLGTFGLTTADFESVANRIGDLGRPTVVIQEGGYATDALGANAASFLRALS